MTDEDHNTDAQTPEDTWNEDVVLVHHDFAGGIRQALMVLSATAKTVQIAGGIVKRCKGNPYSLHMYNAPGDAIVSTLTLEPNPSGPYIDRAAVDELAHLVAPELATLDTSGCEECEDIDHTAD